MIGDTILNIFKETADPLYNNNIMQFRVSCSCKSDYSDYKNINVPSLWESRELFF